MPLPFAQMPVTSICQDNTEKSPSVDKLSRIAAPMISVPNPALFHAPPPPFNLPSLLPNHSGSPQNLPLFPNPPPIFSHPPPPMMVTNQRKMDEKRSPDNDLLFKNISEINRDSSRNNYATNQSSGRKDRLAGISNESEGNNEMQSIVETSKLDARPYGRLLPRPGQVDLYPSEEKTPMPGISQMNDQQAPQLQKQQQQLPHRPMLMNGLDRQGMQQMMLPQGPPPFVGGEQISHFNFSNGMLDTMLNQAFMDQQQITFNNFDNPPFNTETIQNNNNNNNQQFQHRGRGFHKNRRRRRGGQNRQQN